MMYLIIMLSSGVFLCFTIKKSDLIHIMETYAAGNPTRSDIFQTVLKRARDYSTGSPRASERAGVGRRSRSGEEKTANAACFEPRRLPFGDSLLKLHRMSQRASSLQEPLLLRVQSGFILSVLLRASLEGKRSLLLFVLSVRWPAASMVISRETVEI